MNNCVRTNLFSTFDCIWLLERLPQVSAQREHTIEGNMQYSDDPYCFTPSGDLPQVFDESTKILQEKIV